MSYTRQMPAETAAHIAKCLTVECPICKEPAGKMCHNIGGKTLTYPHKQRHNAALGTKPHRRIPQLAEPRRKKT